MPLTDEQLAAIEAAVAKMTPGPWESYDTEDGDWIILLPPDRETSVHVLNFGDMENNTGRDIANADGIALLRNHAETILADLRAARQERDRALNVRPEVAAFALAMEERLRANDHKGGWKECDIAWLWSRFRDEVSEFTHAQTRFMVKGTGGTQMRHEAADVANFLMMILDVAGALAATEEEKGDGVQ